MGLGIRLAIELLAVLKDGIGLWNFFEAWLGGNRSLPTSLCGEWPALSGFERFE